MVVVVSIEKGEEIRESGEGKGKEGDDMTLRCQ